MQESLYEGMDCVWNSMSFPCRLSLGSEAAIARVTELESGLVGRTAELLESEKSLRPV
jgi:hypothetical protein